jgi:hypothetical protein
MIFSILKDIKQLTYSGISWHLLPEYVCNLIAKGYIKNIKTRLY